MDASTDHKDLRLMFSGSFDPWTMGHMRVVERVAPLCGTLYVVVFDNVRKRTVLSAEDRARLIREACRSHRNVVVDIDHGLLVDYCERMHIDAIVRGVRDATHFQEELIMADANRHLSDGIETLLLPARGAERFISSSLVRELVGWGRDVRGLVPECIRATIETAYARKP
ncbi:MAG: pantetheine-phosphate adenylyltransferase [Saccharofermentanales bacterium]|jgi:pantetheine-phosphate adenylyltransferase